MQRPHPARAGYRFRPDAKDTSVGQGQRLAGRLRRRTIETREALAPP